MLKKQAPTSAPDPVSAFAARRSRPNSFTKPIVISKLDQTRVFSSNADEENLYTTKRRKIESTIRTPSNVYPLSKKGIGQSKVQKGHLEKGDLNSSEESKSSHETDNSEPRSHAYEISDGSKNGSSDDSSDLESISRSHISIRKLSTFLPTGSNVIGETEKEWTIYLTDGDELTLLGQYDLWVRQGAVHVLGALLHPSSQLRRIYAPSTHALPYIRHARNPAGPKDQPAQITIYSSRSCIRLLRKLSPLYCRIWNEKHTRSLGKVSSINGYVRSFAALSTSAEDPHKRPLTNVDVLPGWQTCITNLANNESTKPKVVLVCGPKGSGKSTFTRILLNSLLSKSFGSRSGAMSDGIALLDLDPGQPEFSPPGELSLLHLRSFNFGPPFTHPVVSPNNGSQLVRAHHLGVLSPYDDLKYYLACADDLLNSYRKFLVLYPSCPLIINSCGWVFGGGSEVLAQLIQSSVITDVVYMSTEGPPEVVEILGEAARMVNKTFLTVDSQPSEFTTRNASELRVMQSLSYFHLDLIDREGLRWNCSTLSELRPVCVKYERPNRALFGILVLGEEQDPDFLHHLLNGSIVGLVAIEDDSCLRRPEATGLSTSDRQIKEAEVGQFVALPELDGVESPEPDGIRSNCSSDCRRSENGQLHKDVRGHSLGQADLIQTEATDSGILLNAEGLPYFSARDGVCLPLDPGKTQCLGQALIRGIDTKTKTLFLITPVPLTTLQSIHRKGIKLVLVRGNLDTPTWAYQEEYIKAAREAKELQASRAEPVLQAEETGSVRTKRQARNPQDFAPGTPWVTLAPGHNRRCKVWRVQKDLKARERGTEDD